MIARGRRRLARLRPEDPRTVGPYQIVGRVGSGGMGTVYAGTTPELSGYLAVKVVHEAHAVDPGFRRRFAREARLMVRVDSPCVPRFVRADVEAPVPWLATEFVPGPTLRHHVERRAPLRGGMLLGLAAGVAEALRSMHAAGIVHRDLKPSNVVLAPGGPKVLDFGIAHAAEDPTLWLRLRRMRRRVRDLRLPVPAALPPRPGPAPAPAGTGRPDLVGTPGWISPEQYRGRPVTARSDVFLWGALVGFAAARHDPFGHGHPAVLARRVLREDPDLAGLPAGLEELVLAAMAKDPEDRPSSTELLRRVLDLAEPAGRGDGADEGDGRPRTDRQRVRSLLAREWTRVSARPPKPPAARPAWLPPFGAGRRPPAPR
ncbi:serine/threonine-protein kinase [Marinitenerispora sediminis]|uniref:Serine/threonine protein kinase n=1 Tax=Marinitenerispora sediminis TaxID=1931232 RepID=A0A368T4C1_9ACTN|nr:serine/threonine-protein kinase [Marinitenerispora sediminis]RCV51956.1 serine/threonine protein kinase [Marinitenerispora sediminis]RCV55398.1 serine/threonine protein kinase [Marinitenerispora sediminis]RCV58199.1 serine/threonine protein kinase [Marinitenerispora sediminis]